MLTDFKDGMCLMWSACPSLWCWHSSQSQPCRTAVSSSPSPPPELQVPFKGQELWRSRNTGKTVCPSHAWLDPPPRAVSPASTLQCHSGAADISTKPVTSLSVLAFLLSLLSLSLFFSVPGLSLVTALRLLLWTMGSKVHKLSSFSSGA